MDGTVSNEAQSDFHNIEFSDYEFSELCKSGLMGIDDPELDPDVQRANNEDFIAFDADIHEEKIDNQEPGVLNGGSENNRGSSILDQGEDSFDEVDLDGLSEYLESKGEVVSDIDPSTDYYKLLGDILDNYSMYGLSVPYPELLEIINNKKDKKRKMLEVISDEGKKRKTPQVIHNEEDKRMNMGRSKDMKKTREKAKKPIPPPAPEPDMPHAIRNTISELGCTVPPQWLNEKLLFASDTDPLKVRLNLPSSQALLDFLEKDEKKHLIEQTPGKKKKKEIRVTVVDLRGGTTEMMLKKWSGVFVLSGSKWNDFVKKFKLQARKLKLRIWCFRKGDSSLCFAIDVSAVGEGLESVSAAAEGKGPDVNQQQELSVDNKGCDEHANPIS